MKTFSLLLPYLLSCCLLKAQYSAKPDTTRQLQNSFYAEIAGTALFGVSFNYERFLSKKPGGFSIRGGLGIGYVPGIFDDGFTYGVFPVGLSYNIPVGKSKQNFIELGADYTFIFGTQDDNTQFQAALLGWRYQSKSGKFQIRSTFYPLLYSLADDERADIPWFGFSIGTRF